MSSPVPPARASEVLRLGNTQAITRCGEPLQLHEPMQLQSWAGIFDQNHTEQRAIAGPRAFNGLYDDEGVPLICPTCQVLAQSVLAGDRLLLCMGLFSIFSMGMAGFYLVLAIYLQQECGLDALQAGTILVTNGLGYLASSSVARLADQRLGRQVLALAGILRPSALVCSMKRPGDRSPGGFAKPRPSVSSS
jgi:hypothetical protein